MTGQHTQKIELVSISSITPINPRTRNKRQHREIVDNIDAIGLKRPITVSQRSGPDGNRYDLVCGEGRLEAFKQLGATEIPAVVIQATENDCLVMSLVENIARRKHRPIDLMQEIGNLAKRGYTDKQIAEKTGISVSYANMVTMLLEHGEERLVSAVESGLMPLSLAIMIARSETANVQNLLMDAYESGQIKGKKLAAIRRLLDQRERRHRRLPDSGFGSPRLSRRITPADLMKVYQREAEKQRILVKKSDYAQIKLLFIVEALKDLLLETSFTQLLQEERLHTMPRALAARISGELPQ
jgi:ParB family chromosome partitioning protein